MMAVMDGIKFRNKLKSDDRINHILVILITVKSSNEFQLKGYGPWRPVDSPWYYFDAMDH